MNQTNQMKRAIAAERLLDNLHLYLNEMLQTQDHPLIGKDEIMAILMLTALQKSEEASDGT